MTLELWESFSKRNNSTKQPFSSADAEKEVKLKEGTSFLNPVFILHSNNGIYNYCRYRGRFYFVTDIVSLANGYTEYHCKADVLGTWKSYIGSSYQYVTRAGSQNDVTLIDNFYPVKAQASLSKLPLSTFHGYIVTGGYYVIGVVGGASASSGAVNYYAMTPSQIEDLLNYMFDISIYDIDGDEISKDLQKALINPFQYIVSAIWLPGTMPVGTPVPVKFGWWTATGGASGVLLPESDRTETHSTIVNMASYKHPKAISQGLTYLNGSPYTRMILSCYMFGSIPLDPVWFMDTYSCNLIVKIDRFTGVGELIIENSSSAVVYKASAQMGVPVQLAQLTQNLLSSAVSGLGGLVSLATGGITSGISGIASAVESSMPQMASNGSNGSKIAYDTVPSITFIHYDIANTDKSHFGAPVCANKMISSLAGFIMCEDPDIDIPSTYQEREEVNKYMTEGFFYE